MNKTHIQHITSTLMRYGVPLPAHLNTYFNENIQEYYQLSSNVLWHILCDIYRDYPTQDLNAWFQNYAERLAELHKSDEIHSYYYDSFKRLHPMLVGLYGAKAIEQLSKTHKAYPGVISRDIASLDVIEYAVHNMKSFILDEYVVRGFNTLSREEQKPLLSTMLLNSIADEELQLASLSQNISVYETYNAQIRFQSVEDVLETLIEYQRDHKYFKNKELRSTFWISLMSSTENLALKKMIVTLYQLNPTFKRHMFGCEYLYALNLDRTPLESLMNIPEHEVLFNTLLNEDPLLYYQLLLKEYQERMSGQPLLSTQECTLLL